MWLWPLLALTDSVTALLKLWVDDRFGSLLFAGVSVWMLVLWHRNRRST